MFTYVSQSNFPNGNVNLVNAGSSSTGSILRRDCCQCDSREILGKDNPELKYLTIIYAF